jgi:membrane associated rhomboid family serine protease
MSVIEDIKEQFQRPNNALVKLILINVLVYAFDCLLFIISKLSGTEELFIIPYYYQSLPGHWHDVLYQPWTLLTYFFTHEIPSPLHILFNMLGLYWFGMVVQDLIGSKKLTSIYILGGLFAGIVFLFVLNFIPYFAENHAASTLVGASGSVYAIVIAAAVLAPNYKFYMLLLGPVKISYIAIFYIFISLIGTVGSNAGGNIAHLGGAFMGYFFISQLKKGNDLGQYLHNFSAKVKGLFNRSKRIKVSYKNENAEESPKAKQAQIDAILDKISQSGYESLSKEEKRKLFDASK